MINECEHDITKIMLCDADFPSEYIGMKHPDDYKLQDLPVIPTFTINQRQGHSRLILRISWKVGEKYMPMSFIVDTGVCQPIFFCSSAMRAMEENGLLLLDDLQNDAVKIHCFDCSGDHKTYTVHYQITPNVYEPANIIGLRFLLRFGFHVGDGSFRFDQSFEYF